MKAIVLNHIWTMCKMFWMVTCCMFEKNLHEGLGSWCMIFSWDLHAFLWPYYTWLNVKCLRCPAFDKRHTKEMIVCMIGNNCFAEVLLDFMAHFLDAQTGAMAAKVPWIRYFLKMELKIESMIFFRKCCKFPNEFYEF